MLKKRLKGGSLSGTYYVEDAGRTFIRKECSLEADREFGFQRWYSQLKRQQRYADLFPGLYPEILAYGREGELAYFDLAFVSEAVSSFDFLQNSSDEKDARPVFDGIVEGLARMHQRRFASSPTAIDLYLYEKVERKLGLCRQEPFFAAFSDLKNLQFNDQDVRGFWPRLARFSDLMQAYYTEVEECCVHGNITLENTLFCPKDQRVFFIDTYEENIIDSPLVEYSQLLQSASSHYELLNASASEATGNRLSAKVTPSAALQAFNALLSDHLDTLFTPGQRIAIRLFEISQFIRMLPFKVKLDPDKALLFYGLASKLLQDLEDDLEGKAP
ncbi:phosphotransferase [Rhodovibrionaceae bacterium A322]